MSGQLRVRPRAPKAPPSMPARARAGLGAGARLDDATRATLEAGFGQDLGHVRVHRGAHADAATRALGAQAFALGSDIAVSSRHNLGGAAGRALLTHEMAHVVQQAKGGSAPGARHERAADDAAFALAHGARAATQPGAAYGVQRRVEIRDVGRGEFSGMGRVGELIDRLNAISTALIFSLGTGGVLEYTENPYGDETEFDRRMKRFIDSTDIIPLRMTNRHGLMRDRDEDPYSIRVRGDSFMTGYVDIDDVLATDDLALQGRLIHYLTERGATRNYARRMAAGTLTIDPAFHRAHDAGIDAERDLLRDYFGDPRLRTIDGDQRIFRSSRGDTVIRRTRDLHGDREGTFEARYEVVVRRTGQRMTPEDYRALLERERAAAAPAAPAAAGAGAGAP